MITRTTWDTVPLGHIVVDSQYGTANKANENSQGLPIVRMNNLTVDGEIDLSEVKHVEVSAADADRYILRRGDLLFNRTNSPDLVGKTAVWNRDDRYAFAGYLVRFRLDEKVAYSSFVARWFNTPLMKTELRRRAKPSINMSNISASSAQELLVPLPPLSEQRRIVSILDQADALRAKRRAALAQLDTLSQSIFLDMFGDPARNPRGWPVRLLGDIAIDFRYGTSNRSSEEGRWTLRIPNVIDGSIDLHDLKRVHITDAEFKRLRLQRGDLLFVRTNGNPDFVGRCAIYDPDIARGARLDDEFIFASYLIRGRIRDGSLLPVFLREFLSTREGRRCLRARCKTSAGQFNLSVEGLRTIPVVVPPQELQHSFVQRVRSIEIACARNHEAAAKADALFASLQHRAFRGEL